MSIWVQGDSSIVSSVADVIGKCVVRGMRGVGCLKCVCVWFGAWWEVRDERFDWVWALPILWEQGECGTCVCVWVAAVCVV